ncbi:MAG: UDP-N-acetylglucosamine pyrophosphorylase [Eubacterium sp.]|nr:UDP-N-acetylglucosamine pyrophosphorylase [Eubacterium sp.]
MKLFTDVEYPFEVLSEIGKFILDRGRDLPPNRFNKVGKDVWIAKTAKVSPTASITGPCIIDEDAEIRHCAFIRGNVVVGKKSVVGNSTELKNCILFDEVQVPHYNYVGDSILGFKSHMGAGSITSNVKSDRTLVEIRYGRQKLATGLKKFGAVIGDFSEIGCGAVLNPGSVIGKDTVIYPLSSVRGYVPNKSIYKTNGAASIIPKTYIDQEEKK